MYRHRQRSSDLHPTMLALVHNILGKMLYLPVGVFISFCVVIKQQCRREFLTVGLWGNVKNGFTWKIIIVLKVRGGHGE